MRLTPASGAPAKAKMVSCSMTGFWAVRLQRRQSIDFVLPLAAVSISCFSVSQRSLIFEKNSRSLMQRSQFEMFFNNLAQHILHDSRGNRQPHWQGFEFLHGFTLTAERGVLPVSLVQSLLKEQFFQVHDREECASGNDRSDCVHCWQMWGPWD